MTVPPPGPLFWLFPELAPLAARADFDALEAAARTLARDSGATATVVAGALGEALATVLREHARDPWRQVRVAAATAGAATELGHGVLALGARTTEPLPLSTSYELRDSDVGLVCVPVPLDAAHAEQRVARGDTSTWIVPLGHERTPAVARLQDALASLIGTHAELLRRAGLVPVLSPRSQDPTSLHPTLLHPTSPDPSSPGPQRADAALCARVAPTWEGVVDGTRGSVRDLLHAVVEALHPERVHLLRGFESIAHGGGDLYSEGLRDLLRLEAGGSAADQTPPVALVVAVCGIDGAGKSSHVRALAEHLAAEGLRVKTHKIFRHGVFHDTVTDVTRRTAGARRLHLWRVERMAKAFDSVKYFFRHVEPDLRTHDVLVFDRYTPTHHAAGAGRCHFDPFTREMLAVYPPADCLFFLDAPVDAALARLAARPARTVDENPYMLGRYAAMLRHQLADVSVVLDARAPFADNQAAIRATVDAALRRRGGR